MTEPMTWIAPGEWTAMSNTGVWVLAETAHDQQLVADLWSVSSTPDITADQVLDTMLARGFTSLRGLAIATVVPDGVRVIVRHPAAAIVDAEVIAAPASTTWLDTTRPTPSRLVLTCDGNPAEGLELPLAVGASTAKTMRIDFAEATPQPAVAPEPAPLLVEAPANEYDGPATAFLSKDEILAPDFDIPPVVEPVFEAVVEPVIDPLPEVPEVPVPPLGPTVFAVRCPHGHLTSPGRPACRVCGSTVTDQVPFETAPPPLGHILVPSGDRIPVDGGIVIGRAPVATPGTDQQTIAISFSGEISRQHAEITVDGWNVYVRDLNTTNGTSMASLGQPPMQLRGGEDYLVEPGAEIDLADVVTLRFEATA